MVEAAEKRRSESTYSSVLLKLSQYGRGVGGAMVLLDVKIARLVNFGVYWKPWARTRRQDSCHDIFWRSGDDEFVS